VQVNPQAHYELDLASFAGSILDGQPAALAAAVTLYRGDFLSDFYLENSNEYEEWAAARRAVLRLQTLEALAALADHSLAQSDYVQAEAYAQRQVAMEPLREEGHRQLIRTLARSGRRSAAVAAYDELTTLLRSELGIEPELQTQQLIQSVRQGKPHALSAPGRVRGYELHEPIGEGRFGIVYRAIQPAVGREVAIKAIRRRFSDNPEFIRRFEAEAHLVARLEHPHIVPLYDYWREPGGAYLVMRWMRGGSVADTLKQGPYPVEAVLNVLDQVATALAVAHGRGIIHRDLKPANILLDEGGNAYLSDFGIAKDLHADEALTGSGTVVGSPYYAAPEQLLSEPVSPQTDIYSLGLTLYELLVGAKPYADATPAALYYKQLHEPLPLARAHRPELPAVLDEALRRATAKQPAERFPDITAFAQAMHAALREATHVQRVVTVPAAVSVNPYKGLRPFEEADAARFFGRETLVEQLLARMAGSRFLAVVGPSGSGKSSVVKAGLLPALRRGALPDSDGWFISEMVPGTHPLKELEAALFRVAVNPPETLLPLLGEDERGLARAVKRILPATGTELLLLVDQFEEIFTLVTDEAQRHFFLNSLAAAVADVRGRLRLVITLRADFYDRPLMYQTFGELMRQYTAAVVPSSKEDLAAAIRRPAQQVGVRVEDDLQAEMVADVYDRPGALPLLQYALTELFERRESGRMTLAAYEAVGRVSGALSQRAETLYRQLSEQEQLAARQLFLRLVALGEAGQVTRRRVARSELEAIRLAGEEAAAAVNRILDLYGRYRLLTFDHDPATRVPTVEVAHEALLTAWTRLREWIEVGGEDLRQQRRLRRWALEWQEAGREPGLLLRSARLEQMAGWAAQTDLALSASEQAYLETSIAARQERLAAEEARRQRELETAQHLAETERQRAEEQSQAARRLQRRAVYLVGALVTALLLAIVAVAFQQSANRNADMAITNASLAMTREAEAEENARLAANRQSEAEAEANLRAMAEAVAIQERETAEQQQAIAEEQREIAGQQVRLTTSRELALAALTTLDTDPELSLLLALQGLQVAHTREAENILHQALAVSRVERTLFGHELEVSGLAFSRDGRLLASGSVDTVVRIWEVDSGRELHALTGFEDMIYGLDFDPAGQRLAASSWDGTVRIWNVNTGVEQMTLVMPTPDGSRIRLDDVEFSPDGQFLAVGGRDQTVVWDLETEQPWLVFPQGRYDVTFSPNGRLLAFRVLKTDGAGPEAVVTVWDLEAGQELAILAANVIGLAFSPDGKLLAAEVPSPGATRIWHVDLDSPETFGQELARLGGAATGSDSSTITFLPDNRRVLYLGNESHVKVWNIEGPAEILNVACTPGPFAVAVNPTGTLVATSNTDGAIKLCRLEPTYEWQTLDMTTALPIMFRNVAFSPDGSILYTIHLSERLQAWDTMAAGLLQPGDEVFLVEDLAFRDGLAVSPEGDWLTVGTSDGHVYLFDAKTGAELAVLRGDEDGLFWGVAIHPDGTQLAAAGTAGTARVWDPATGEELYALADCADTFMSPAITFSPDGQLLVTVCYTGTVAGWEAATGVERFRLTETSNYGVAISPDGRYMATTGTDAIVRLWDLTTDDGVPREIRQMTGHTFLAMSPVFSPDGTRLATGSFDKTIRVWNVMTGAEMLTLRGHTEAVWDVAFSPDGKRLASASWDGTARVFLLDLDEVVELARSRLTRWFTPDECQRYLHTETCPPPPEQIGHRPQN
ncbi:MAG: protein kinase, partial [Chloroflexota bacterium]